VRKSLALLVILSCLATTLTIPDFFSGANAVDNTWVSKEPMPTARTFLGAAEVNGKIYAIGGFSDLNNTEEYDPITDTWTTKAAIPSPRFWFATAVYQNKIYCIGGLVGGGPPFSSSVTGAIEVYDPATNTWEIKKPMPTPRAHLVANVINDKIYLIGGRTGGPYSTVSTNQVYDPNSEKWETKKPMPYPVAAPSSTVVGNKIYVLGGQDEFNDPKNLNVTQIYDSTTDSWTIGTPMQTTALNSAACTISDPLGSERIYLIGGQLGALAGGNRTNLVQVYNPKNSNWSIGVPMLTARYGLAVAVVNNTIYAIGGVGGNIMLSGEGYAENEAYTPIVDHPPSSSPSQTPLPTQESFPTPAVVAISTVAVVVIGFCLLVYFKKRKPRADNSDFFPMKATYPTRESSLGVLETRA
jgi:N-acetylneuraminic acid mutarotase